MKYPYEIGQVLYWNQEVVPLEKQPRPFYGIVVGDWHNGLIVQTRRDDPTSEVHYKYIDVEKLAVIL